MNLISNFSCGGEVKSVLLPYSCAKCMKEFVFLIEDVERLNIAALPSPKCERSDCEAQCDDDPEEYLSFLKS